MSEEKLYILTAKGEQDIKRPEIKYDAREQEKYKNMIATLIAKDFILPESGRLIKVDSNESIFLRDKLTYFIEQAMEAWYPDRVARQIFSTRNTGTPGARSIEYTEEYKSGRARLAGVKTTSSAKSDISAKPIYSPVYNIENTVEYSFYDLESALFANIPLNQKLLTADRESHEIAFDEQAFSIQDTTLYPEEADIPGVLNQLDKFITKNDTSALNDWNILTSTPQDNYDKLMAAINSCTNFTQKNEAIPTDLVLNIQYINFLKSQKFSNTLGETVASAIFKNSSITRMIPAPELKNTAVGDPLMIGNFQNRNIGELIVTRNYTLDPVRQTSDGFEIKTRSGHAGLFIYKKAWAFVENIGA